MQTKVQKIMFDHWGETLAMDFIHGTNNLGYHLGAFRNSSNLIDICSGAAVALT
jgi:hypothetical protein